MKTTTQTNGTVDQIRSRMSDHAYSRVFQKARRSYCAAVAKPEHYRLVQGPTEQAAWNGALAGAVFAARLGTL